MTSVGQVEAKVRQSPSAPSHLLSASLEQASGLKDPWYLPLGRDAPPPRPSQATTPFFQELIPKENQKHQASLDTFDSEMLLPAPKAGTDPPDPWFLSGGSQWAAVSAPSRAGAQSSGARRGTGRVTNAGLLSKEKVSWCPAALQAPPHPARCWADRRGNLSARNGGARSRETEAEEVLTEKTE